MITKDIWKLQSLEENFILEEDELQIWRVKLSDELHNLEQYWSILTDNEQAHANEFHFLIDKNRYIVARAILRKLIAKYINIDSKNIVFGYTDYAKPYLINNDNISELKFNLSHSEDSIIYGFTRNMSIGVDIEFFNQELEIEDIIDYCCSSEEKIKLKKLSNDHKYFYKLWVLKESLVKAIGLGLSYDFREINIDIDSDSDSDIVRIISPNKDNWMLQLFLSYNGYYSAFACEKSIKNILYLTYLDF